MTQPSASEGERMLSKRYSKSSLHCYKVDDIVQLYAGLFVLVQRWHSAQLQNINKKWGKVGLVVVGCMNRSITPF